MFELPGIRGGRCYEDIEEIAAAYVVQLGDEYPQGPIFLAAFCAGGLIALEMAAQLAEMGRPISHLVLLDPPIRHGTLGVGRILSRTDHVPQDSVPKAMLRRVLPMRLLCRYHDLKYRTILMRTRRAGNLRYAESGFSIKAQAKLYVAFLRSQPRHYAGPGTILSSSESSRASRGGTRLRDLLPQMRIQLITVPHSGMAGSAIAARIMQAVFDAAIYKG
jgi:thioesterase domain-containing protein